MKTSFCTIAYRNQRASLKDIIFKVSDCGYDAVEIWGHHISKASSLWDIKYALAITGIGVSVVSPYFNFTGNAGEWKKGIARAEYFIECASELGASAIRCFTGRIGSGAATAEQWRDCITGMRAIADMAGRKGVSVLIETHPDTLADTTASTLRLIKGIARENAGIIYDFYNMWETEPDSLHDSFLTLFPYVRHVHLKNAITGREKNSPFSLVHTKEPDLSSISYLEEGDVDYHEFLELLRNKQYEGYVSIEWFGHDVDAAALHEYEYLRNNMRSTNAIKSAGSAGDDRQRVCVGV